MLCTRIFDGEHTSLRLLKLCEHIPVRMGNKHVQLFTASLTLALDFSVNVQCLQASTLPPDLIHDHSTRTS